MDKPSIIPFKTFVKDVKQLKKRYKNILDDNDTIYLVKMYDKSEIENIKTQKLLEIIKEELA